MSPHRAALLAFVLVLAASAESSADPGDTLAHMQAQMACEAFGQNSDVCRSAKRDIRRGNSGETLARMQARMTCDAFGQTSQACLSAKKDLEDTLARDSQPFGTPQYRPPYLGSPSRLPTGSHDATGNNTITFINRSGEPALVKLRGATNAETYVPNGSSATVNAFGGLHYILTRYGASPPYSYSKGENFSVEETYTQYSAVSITLHKVANGNYDSRTISAADFDGR
jgi:hypothetical protein